MKLRIIATALAFVISSTSAQAAPSLIAYGDINQATLEDFEDSSIPTFPGSTYAFDGFDYSSGSTRVSAGGNSCPNSSECVFAGGASGLSGRLLDVFQSGTIAIGLEIGKVRDSDDVKATVVGASGSMTFSNIASGLIGFLDPLGLISVTFDNLGAGGGVGNYGFDNVITGTTVVPLPAGLPLLAVSLLALGLLRRRAKGA